jgi:YVTN family beta-propeller protein
MSAFSDVVATQRPLRRHLLRLLSAAACALVAFAPVSRAAPVPPAGFEKISARVWAFVAQDERSANGALFIGNKEALVVDPGLTPAIAQRFLAGVRAITDRPIRTVVLSHWHPDHALGIACLAEPDIALAATPATRRALAENLAAISHAMAQNASASAERDTLHDCAIRLPDTLIDERREFDLGGHVVKVWAPGIAHTDGDLLVYSPSEQVLVTGDLFLNRSSPDMQEGRVAGLLDNLNRLLTLPIKRVIPGHFELSDKAGLARYRDYVYAVYDSARTAVAQGSTIGDTLPAALDAFKDFRQFPQYQATFADNLRAAAAQIREQPAKPGDGNGFRRLRRLTLGKNPHQIAFSPDGRWAYVAIAGDDRVARVDVASLTPAGTMAVADAPLGVHALATDDLLVTRFGANAIERRRWNEATPLATLPSGIGTSLFSGPLPDGSLLATVERSNLMLRVAADNLAPIASFATGTRPFPPAATSDGRLAFVPNYDDGSVSVIDLWNGTLRATVAVGGKPSGGTVLPGDSEYAVAVRGENRIAFINTASKTVVGSLADGIGASPFSVVLAPNGRLAFVNNTASHDVSVIALPEKRVIARIPTGEIPIVMAVHPSGETLWVSCEGSHTLDVIAIPRAWREAVSDATTAPAVTEVAVLGMIHGDHRTSSNWSLDAVRAAITRYRPDVVIAEIAPDRWPRIWSDYAERGVIEDSRVLRFPEYTDVLLPLKVRMGFAVEPGAAWTQEMSDLREARIHVFEHDPAFAERNSAYQAALKAAEAQDPQHVVDSNDPQLIHSDEYDRMTKIALTPYDEYLNDVIGPGGWTNINVAHYRLIDAAIRRHRGERILITFGAAHKYWLLEQLRQRDDIRLLDVREFLPKP